MAVPSRRSGHSLGVNNITPKVCSYACQYCQVGPTTEKIVEPRGIFSPAEIHDVVTTQLAKARERGLPVDYQGARFHL